MKTTVSLDDYERQIEEILASDLSANGKAAALHLTAQHLDRAIWSLPARARARELAARAREAMGDADWEAGLGEVASGFGSRP